MSKKAVALNPMGLKRICTNCGLRFYDLNKRPIICPACETEFTGDVKLKTRRGRLAAIDPKKDDAVVKSSEVENDDEILDEDEGIEVVSLEDADDDIVDDDDDTILGDDDTLEDIPDFEDDGLDDLDEDDDAILEDDED